MANRETKATRSDVLQGTLDLMVLKSWQRISDVIGRVLRLGSEQ